MNSNEIREKAYDAIDAFLKGLQEGKYSSFSDFPISSHGPFEQAFNFAKDLIDEHGLVGYKHYDRNNLGGIIYLRDKGMRVNDLGGIREFVQVKMGNSIKPHSKSNGTKQLDDQPSTNYYCIWHGFPFNGIAYNLGVEKSFVLKMAKAYLRGENEIYISGRSYDVGSENFQIFEMPAEFNGPGSAQRYFDEVYSGNVSERTLAKIFKTVTNDFIQDRPWSALKDDFFNIQIIDQEGPGQILWLLKKPEIESFLQSFANGEKTQWIGGNTVKVNSPKALKIFNISFEYLEQDRGALLSKMETWSYGNNLGIWDSKMLKKFGSEVTTDFQIKPFGQYMNKISLDGQDENDSKNDVYRIVISHSSKDAEIVKKFVDLILNNSLGVVASQIFCTSVEGLGIRSGADFKKVIKDEILKSDLVIQIISRNYKSSEICLNEMGAAWVLSKEVIPFILGENYDVGFIHANSQQLKITSKEDLLQFIEDKKDAFPNRSPLNKINRHIDDFIKLFK